MPITLHPRKLAGVDAAKKLKQIAAALEGVDGLVVSDPHAVAWAFNIRGGDVSHTPLPLSFALIPASGMPSRCIFKPFLAVYSRYWPLQAVFSRYWPLLAVCSHL